MSEAIYLLDSNIFIQAHRRHYPFDVFPGFWRTLEELAAQNIIKSIDKVKIELIDKGKDGDEIKSWCTTSLDTSFFLPTATAFDSYQEIIHWASSNKNYYSRAKEKFLATDHADSWLCAMANLDKRYVIITEEVSQPDIKREIKIPEVCHEFRLDYMNTIDLLRKLNVQF